MKGAIVTYYFWWQLIIAMNNDAMKLCSGKLKVIHELKLCYVSKICDRLLEAPQIIIHSIILICIVSYVQGQRASTHHLTDLRSLSKNDRIL